MKRIFSFAFLAVLLSGCFETDFNFKTVIHPNGKMDRTAQISSRGPSRFLAPAGPEWQVKLSQEKGEQAIFDDSEHIIFAEGHFNHPSEFTSDFKYDTSKLMENIDDEMRTVFRDELKIPEPYESAIGADNKIEFSKKSSFFKTTYHYTEVFEIRYLIPILLSDAKMEIIRDLTEKTPASDSVPNEAARAISNTTPPLPAPEEIEALAQKKLNDDILTKFQFHSEVNMPGKIKSTNASNLNNSTAIWDFKASDFQETGRYELHLITEATNKGILIVILLIFLAAIWVFAFLQKRRVGPKRSK